MIETLNSLASAYTQRGRLADALATYREILTIDPEQATTTRAPQQQVGQSNTERASDQVSTR